MIKQKWYRRWPIYIIAITILTASIGFLSSGSAADRPTEPPKEVVEAPTPVPQPAKQGISEAEAKRLSDTFQKITDERLRNSQVVPIAGPETRGTKFPHQDKVVQLPNDAYVKQVIFEVSCLKEFFCPEAPYSIIHRNGANVILAGSFVYFAGTDEENDRAKREGKPRLLDEFGEHEKAIITKEFQFLKEIFGEIQTIQHPSRR